MGMCFSKSKKSLRITGSKAIIITKDSNKSELSKFEVSKSKVSKSELCESKIAKNNNKTDLVKAKASSDTNLSTKKIKDGKVDESTKASESSTKKMEDEQDSSLTTESESPGDSKIEEKSNIDGLVDLWVQKVLEKGVQGIRKEFRETGLKTQPTADEYKESLKNKPFGRNRYGNVYCLDFTRVILKNSPTGNDYINANYVSTPFSNKRFICTQAPKTETIYDFWFMILQEKVEYIVMLGNFFEKNYEKCSKYFPLTINESMQMNDITIKYISGGKDEAFSCEMVRRCFTVKRNTTLQKVTHYQWIDWPDHGVPKAEKSALGLLAIIRMTVYPIVIHCSAGIGRTGCIVAIEYVLEKLQSKQNCSDMSAILIELRKQRARIIQNDMQYLFVHRILLEFFIQANRITETTDINEFIKQYELFVSMPNPPV